MVSKMGFLNIFNRKKQEQELTTKTNEILKSYYDNDSDFQIKKEKLIDEYNKTNDDTVKQKLDELINTKPLVDTDKLKEVEKLKIQNFLKISNEELQKLKADINLLLAIHKRPQATEKIALEFLQNHNLHTIRSDKEAEMWVYNEGVYISKGKTYVLEWVRVILGEAYTTQLHNEVLAKIQADTFINAEEFFAEKEHYLVPLQNGLFDIKTKRLNPFTPNKIFFNKLPISFDELANCENIIKHFNTVLEHPEQDILIIQELFGYTLLKKYKYEKAFMFLGTGRNGKGKTLLLMKNFLGIENCSSIPLQELDNNNFAKAELFGKLANLGGDLSPTALKETGNFKQITGGDLISADRKFRERVKFINYAKMVFCANELPKTYDDTVAFFDRWILLNFPYTFKSKQEYEELIKKRKDTSLIKIGDPNLINKLTTQDELSGLFNWALIGLERLEQQQGFSVSKTTEQVKNDWTRKSDSFSAFFMDCLEMTSLDLYIEKKALNGVYTQYCKKHNLKVEGNKHINWFLESKGAYSDKKRIYDDNKQVISQPFVFFGIRFKDNCSNCSNCSNDSNSIQNFNFPIRSKTTSQLEQLEQQTTWEDIKNV